MQPNQIVFYTTIYKQWAAVKKLKNDGYKIKRITKVSEKKVEIVAWR